MKRRSVLKFAGALPAPFILSGRYAAAQTPGKLVVASYGGAATKSYRDLFGDPFAKASGIQINFAEVPNSATTAMSAKGTGSIDLALAVALDMPTLSDAGAIEPIPASRFPRLDRTPERFRFLDKNGNVLAICFYAMYYGISFNGNDAAAADFSSWADLADKKWKEKIALNRPQWGAAYELTMMARSPMKSMGASTTSQVGTSPPSRSEPGWATWRYLAISAESGCVTIFVAPPPWHRRAPRLLT